jgi:Lhr-like helicase
VAEELDQLGDAIEVLAVEPLRTVEKDVQRNLVVMRSKQAASYPTRPTR